MATQTHVNGNVSPNNITVKVGLARMLQGGVIMDVVNAEQVSQTRSSIHWPTKSDN
jgi:pyridoxal 5'-phosphate synthase pdxS subunit